VHKNGGNLGILRDDAKAEPSELNLGIVRAEKVIELIEFVQEGRGEHPIRRLQQIQEALCRNEKMSFHHQEEAGGWVGEREERRRGKRG